MSEELVPSTNGALAPDGPPMSIEGMTAEGVVVDAEPHIAGPAEFTLDVGESNRPTVGEFDLGLGMVPTGEQFGLGERVRLVLDVDIAEVRFIEKAATRGKGPHVVRRHVAKLIRVVSAE